MIKIKSVRRNMFESVADTEWDNAQAFAKSEGGTLTGKSPREVMQFLQRHKYPELVSGSEFVSDTLPTLYRSGNKYLVDKIRELVKAAGCSYSKGGSGRSSEYSWYAFESDTCYSSDGKKRSISSLLSGKDLEDYKELQGYLKKYSDKSVKENRKRRIVEEEEAYYKLNVHTKEITQRAKNGRTVNLSSGLGRPIEMSFSGKLCHIETAPGVKEGDAGFSVWIETKSLLDAIRQATERGEVEGGEK